MEQEMGLYIPTGVRAEKELFHGFGWREVTQSVAGSLMGGMVAAFLWLATGNVALTVVTVLSGIFGSVMMCTRDQNNQSVVDQVGNLSRYHRSQQTYPYRMMDEWGLREKKKGGRALTFLDLFAGIGGGRRGLERSGHTCVGHVEVDTHANRSYMAMYGLSPYKGEAEENKNISWLCHGEGRMDMGQPEWFAKDIKQLTAGEIPKAEIWAFGFPCTDLSVSGRMAGLHGTRSGLFFEVTRLLKGTVPENKPRYLLIENVKHLLSSNGGRDFTTVLAELWEAGYGSEWCVVNSKDFGVPQHWERVYLVGYLGGRRGRGLFPIRSTDPAPPSST